MTVTTDREVSAFATALRQARLGRSLSVADLARQLRLSDTQVLGLESDDLKAFYGPDYARRAALRCAEFLGVELTLEGAPAESVVAEPVVETSSAFVPYRATPAFSVRPGWIVAGLGAIAVVAVAAYLLRGMSGEPVAVVTDAAAPATPPAPVATDNAPAPLPPEPVDAAPVPAASTPVPAAPGLPYSTADSTPVPDDLDHRFYLVVTREVTIHATDTNGMVLISGSLQPDAGQRVVGNPPFKVAVSNEDAVEVYYKGKRVRTERNNNEGVSLSVVPMPQGP